MKSIVRTTLTILAVSAFLASSPHADATAGAPGPSPADSSRILYELDFELENQDGRRAHLKDFGGSPLIISMFYASCDSACPLIVNNIKAIERKLEPPLRQRLKVLLVTFDPETDQVAVLKSAATKHGIDEKRWTLGRTSADQAENLAAVLGIKYKKLDAKTINHTSLISVVAADGRILGQTEQPQADADRLVAALKASTIPRWR